MEEVRFQGGEFVRLRIDRDGVSAGCCGVVWGVYDTTPPTCEACFVDGNGETRDVTFQYGDVDTLDDVALAPFAEKLKGIARNLEMHDERRVIEQSARGLYFMAGTSLLIGFGSMIFVINALLCAVLGFWLGRSRSRLAAATILLIGVLAAGVAVFNLFGLGPGMRGGGLIGSAIFIWLGRRSLVSATTLGKSGRTI